MAKTNWRDAVESAKISKKYDCGHAYHGIDTFQIRTESRIGEAWTVCPGCAIIDQAQERAVIYTFRPGDKAPWTKHFLQ